MRPMVEVVKNYINGKWVESKAKETSDVINPATGEVIAKTPMSTVEETNEAIAAAKAAFLSISNQLVILQVKFLHSSVDS